MLMMLADKHTRNFFLLSNPSDHADRGVPAQDALARTPLWLTMMKVFPSGDGQWDPKQANGNDSRQLTLSPQVLICPPPLLGHHPMVTSFLDQSKVIIRPLKDGDGKRTFKLGPINKTHRISHNKALPFLAYLASKPRHNPLQARVAPNGWRTYPADGTPIPGPSPSSKPPEDILTCEPEPEVAPKQSTKALFALPTTPCSVIFINNKPVGTCPPPFASPTPPPSPRVPPPSQCQTPLIPTMTLARNSPTCNQP
ncbi:hypothetical protein O181_040083 [Austropuccinia psidii MF-1]|uniref:Uncharacterized protein n=1 Tax=Austropuccinia psidii MF-1 TaxID=1389203 RepID=A0A9Q3DGI2_9BASI|nr:hypothetical protein [Austropuccinia psidii MF-1]